MTMTIDMHRMIVRLNFFLSSLLTMSYTGRMHGSPSMANIASEKNIREVWGTALYTPEAMPSLASLYEEVPMR